MRHGDTEATEKSLFERRSGRVLSVTSVSLE
jgi:hypothetical protein